MVQPVCTMDEGASEVTSIKLRYKRVVLNQTCSACPEQYDAYIAGNAFYDGKERYADAEGDRRGPVVGYLRLRHGEFRVTCSDVGGEEVYYAEPNGDGMFDPEEREFHLEKAKLAIEHWLLRYMPDQIALDWEIDNEDAG